MSSSATGVGMTICFLGAILLILTQKSSQKFGDVLGILYSHFQKFYSLGKYVHVNFTISHFLITFMLDNKGATPETESIRGQNYPNKI